IAEFTIDERKSNRGMGLECFEKRERLFGRALEILEALRLFCNGFICPREIRDHGVECTCQGSQFIRSTFGNALREVASRDKAGSMGHLRQWLGDPSRSEPRHCRDEASGDERNHQGDFYDKGMRLSKHFRFL